LRLFAAFTYFMLSRMTFQVLISINSKSGKSLIQIDLPPVGLVNKRQLCIIEKLNLIIPTGIIYNYAEMITAKSIHI
jgi:hypothetical protein